MQKVNIIETFKVTASLHGLHIGRWFVFFAINCFLDVPLQNLGKFDCKSVCLEIFRNFNYIACTLPALNAIVFSCKSHYDDTTSSKYSERSPLIN